jgi:cellulose synthase/poly-beta-1,6-N-acetylglucosamine synthase-like glycosyltransferase
MQQVLLIFLLVLFGLYILLILYYWLSWRAIPYYKPQTSNLPSGASAKEGHNPKTKISVIIAARNEEENIVHCLDSLSSQSYPKDLFEVLVVDDHSTDKTAEMVLQYRAGNIKLISLKDHVAAEALNSFKKKAIEIAIQQSTGELIVTTDADCYAPENWLQTLAAFYEEYQPVFIAAPVAINCGMSFIEMFQALDFMALQGITGAAVHKKIHSMCNGANLAYTKKAFEEVGGFTGIDSIASGDDMLLMHKIYKRYPGKTLFLKSKEVIVQTAAVKTIGEFFNQRIRWASKTGNYDDKRIFWALLLVYLFNLSLVFLPVWALFNNAEFDIHLYPVSISISLAELWVIMLVFKIIIELVFLFPVAAFFGKRKLLWLFPFMQPFHIIYTIIAGWLGRFGNYTWKERKVK